MADEYVFGDVIPFGMAMILCGALTVSFCWGLSILVASRGRIRTWIRNPALGEARLTELLPPYREDWTRGLRFMSWWSRLLLPVMLCLPGGLVGFLFGLDRRMTLLDALFYAALMSVPFGFLLFILRHQPNEADEASS